MAEFLQENSAPAFSDDDARVSCECDTNEWNNYTKPWRLLLWNRRWTLHENRSLISFVSHSTDGLAFDLQATKPTTLVQYINEAKLPKNPQSVATAPDLIRSRCAPNDKLFSRLNRSQCALTCRCAKWDDEFLEKVSVFFFNWYNLVQIYPFYFVIFGLGHTQVHKIWGGKCLLYIKDERWIT